MVSTYLKLIVSELQQPRNLRWFGSGWLSGAGALLSGIVAMILVVCLRFPAMLTTPELSVVYASGWLKVFLHAVLILGYVFAVTSLLLRQEKALGASALCLIVVAALLGGSKAEAVATHNASIYFGLDFFVLNVLFLGFLFVPVERLFPNRGDQYVFRPEWREDLFYYLVSSLLVQILAFLTLTPSNIINAHTDWSDLRTHIALQPFWLQLIEIVLFTDVVQYWLHRLFHRIPLLWRFHAVHHSAQHMDWLAGARMHFLEIVILRSVTAVPMMTFGFDPMAVQSYILIVYVTSSFVHANLGWDLSRIERFLVTPRFHHWHHGIEKEAIDVNFAIHFPLIDWLFGTYHLPEHKWPSGYGIAGHPVPQGYWRQFLYPLAWRK